MLQLVYTSVQTRPFSQQDLNKLLLKSRMRNVEAGLTGLLLFSKGTFLQVLEGGAAAVETTFEKILQDDRHTGISIIERDETLENRKFGQWAMGFMNPVATTKILRGFFAVDRSLDLTRLTPKEANALLGEYRSAGANDSQ